MYKVKLKEKLKEKGISQRKLAKAIKRNPHTVNNKIKGANEFFFFEVVDICRVLDIPVPEELCDLFL